MMQSSTTMGSLLEGSSMTEHMGASLTRTSAPAPPRIIAFTNMEDNTTHVRAKVDIQRPLFQPYPSVVQFENYEPFTTHEAQVMFRNLDECPRRIKILPPDSPFFEVSGAHSGGTQTRLQSKIAAGMEVCFTVKFKPQEVREYQVDLICCTEREKFLLPVRAAGHPVDVAPERPIDTSPPQNVEITVSPPSLTVDSAYISLSSYANLKIINRSEVPVKFAWKSFRTVDEEEAERERLGMELNHMEAEEAKKLGFSSLETASLMHPDGSGLGGRGGESDRFDEADEEALDAVSIDVSRAALHYKYRTLRKALADDPMNFADEIFELSPITGEVWANSEVDITVSFRPDTAAEYKCVAYLEVEGQEERPSVHLTACGIGPTAILSCDVMDMGEVFVGATQEFDLAIMNKGDIPSPWNLCPPSTPFGHKFRFEPSEGDLTVGASQQIKVTFRSEVLGEFSEQFRFALRGSEDNLTMQFKGHVIGPKFRFDVEEIDFGLVSYEFVESKALTLINTSEIPMDFVLRIPQDGAFTTREFDVTPSQGSLAPGERTDVKLEFIPRRVHEYECFLTVDVPGVGDALLSVPITADSQVPEVVLQEDTLEFGECFVRYPYEQELVLVNVHPELQAAFEILPQQTKTASIATFEAIPPLGAVPPNGLTTVKVRMVAERLGQFKLPLMVRIRGSAEADLKCVLSVNSVGPRVLLDTTEIKWGKSTCLVDDPRVVSLTNDSLISAPFKVFVKNARSRFRLAQQDGVLEPGQSLPLTVTANVDDTTLHTDTLILLVEEADPIMIPLSARGVGTTMFCRDGLEVVDFGPQLTNKVFERRITLENKGRRNQVLTWENRTIVERTWAQQAKQKKDAKDKKKKGRELAPPQATFNVYPAEIQIRPRTAVTFTFRGYAEQAGDASETLVLHSKVGKERSSQPVMECKVQATILNPLLTPSQDSLEFQYTWTPEVLPETMADVPPVPTRQEGLVEPQGVTLTNSTDVPLAFTLRTELPFNLSAWEHSLNPGESTTITVEFDPTYREDKQSHVVDNKIQIIYHGHPQRDSVPLRGEINYPNLEFEYEAINFGCILNDTEKKVNVRVTNPSTVTAKYAWLFVQDDNVRGGGGGGRGGLAALPPVPVNQTFDIRPFNSELGPGESEEVEFTFYGRADRKFKASCMCEVTGGPSYELGLQGEASTVAFRVDEKLLDFGTVLFTRAEEREFFVHNTGRVPFAYQCRLDKLKHPACFDVSPVSGRVFANDKQRVTVRLRPGLPAVILDTLQLQIAHFEPVGLDLRGVGVYVSLDVNLPREIDEEAVLVADEDAPALDAETAELIATMPQALPAPPLGVTDLVEGGADMSPVRLALERFICDFDHVVVGQTRKRTFKITNTSVLGPVSWSFDKRVLAGTGFHVEPEKVNNLPENATVALTVTFTARKKMPLGHKLIALPLVINHCPPTHLVLKSHVCEPEVALSTEELEFGEVFVGQSRVITVQLHNTSPVIADWSLVRPLASASKDEANFAADCRSGRLQPDEFCNVAVEFVPTEARRHSLVLQLKVASLPRVTNLQLGGDGLVADVVFSPPTATLGPVLPGSEGQRVTVTMENNGARAIEVYCVDFDKKFLEDEAILDATADDIFDEAGILRVRPRAAGDGLPAQVMARHQQADVPREKFAPTVRDQGREHDIIVHPKAEDRDGWLSARCSAVAQQVATACAHSCRTLDSLVEETLQSRSELGRRVRAALDEMTEEEQTAADELARQKAEEEAAAAEAAAAADPKGKKGGAVTPAAEDGEEEEASRPPRLTAEQLRDVLRTRLDEDEACDRGIVLDSLRCQYAERDAVVEAVAAAMPNAVVAVVTTDDAVDEPAPAEEEEEKEQSPRTAGKAGGTKKSADKQGAPDGDAADANAVEAGEEEHKDKGEFIGLASVSVEFERGEEDEFSFITLDALIPSAQVPVPDPNVLLIPEQRTYELVRRPMMRRQREPVSHFTIVDVEAEAAQKAAEEEERKRKEAEEAENPPAKGGKGGKGADPEADPDAPGPEEPEPVPPPCVSRWVLQPQEKRELVVEFKSQELGQFTSSLGFEITGGTREYTLYCVGRCEVPALNTDPRNVFMRRTKALPPNGLPVSHRFVQSESTFHFGPLLLYKKPSDRPPSDAAANGDGNGEGEAAKEESPSNEDEDLDEEARVAAAEAAAEAEAKAALVLATNSDVFRITNSGSYPCKVECSFASEEKPEPVEGEEPPPAADEGEEGSATVFSVEPASLSLELGETVDVRVWAFPDRCGEFRDSLKLAIADNPEPVCFDLCCMGEKPKLSLHGPWETEEGAAAAAAAAAEAAEQAADSGGKDKGGKKGSVSAADAEEEKEDPARLVFDRLRVGRLEQQLFSISNDSRVPVVWKLDSASLQDDEEFQVSPTEGTLAVGASVNVLVSFEALKEEKFQRALTLHYSDEEGGLDSEEEEGRRSELPIELYAEAFEVRAVAFEDDEEAADGAAADAEEKEGEAAADKKRSNDGEVDFGTVRVGDRETKTFTLRNKGKYAIDFSTFFRRMSTTPLKDCVKITPDCGTLEADETVTVSVAFCATNEIVLENNRDLCCRIRESHTGEEVECFSVAVTVAAYFNRFRLQPVRGVNFGALRFSEGERSRSFYLKNEGSFELTFVIGAMDLEEEEIGAIRWATAPALRQMLWSNLDGSDANGGSDAVEESKAAGDHGAEDGEDAIADEDVPEVAPPDGEKQIGCFRIEPRAGVVQPGESVAVEVFFTPEGDRTFREMMQILVSGWDPNDGSVELARRYELLAQSCFPGINAANRRSIFEEQRYVSSLVEAAGDGGRIEEVGVGEVCFAETENMLVFGPVVCDASRNTVCERVRISNPTKVSTVAHFQVLAANEDAAADVDAFKVEPESWDIPPHEHRLVNVQFAPAEMRTYRARFEATVEEASESTSGGAAPNLKFELAGSGTLPCVTVANLSEHNEQGELVLGFGEVHIRRQHTRRILVENHGVIPATCLFDMVDDHHCFAFSARNSSITLKPGDRKELVVKFCPPKVPTIPVEGEGEEKKQGDETGTGNAPSRADVRATISMTVLHNSFEKRTFALEGTCYSCFAGFADLPAPNAEADDDASVVTAASGTAAGSTPPEDGAQGDVLTFRELVLPGAGDQDEGESGGGGGKAADEEDAEAVAEVADIVSFTLRNQQTDHIVRYEWGECEHVTFSPSVGHLPPGGQREVEATFSTSVPVTLRRQDVTCSLQCIEYTAPEDGADGDKGEGKGGAEIPPPHLGWDDMSEEWRPASDEERAAAGEGVGGMDGDGMVRHKISEPAFAPVSEERQELKLKVTAVADRAKLGTDQDSVLFRTTPMFQKRTHAFTLTNDSEVSAAVSWSFANTVSRSRPATNMKNTARTITTTQSANALAPVPCPFRIEPESCTVGAHSSKEFKVFFEPIEVDDFCYRLNSTVVGFAADDLPPTLFVRGKSQRPICHIDLEETRDYLNRRGPNMKNEKGLFSPIEDANIHVVELVSRGTRVRNVCRFHVMNPTSDSYAFHWEAVGDPSSAWNCATSSGMILAGRRGEMIFEFVPEDTHLAESFYRFRIPSRNVNELFLFAGTVAEPRVSFDVPRVDFNAVMIGSEALEQVHLVNHEHVPFNFAFDKTSLMQADGGRRGPVLEYSPMSGMVPPNGRCAITVTFRPAREVAHNFNTACIVRRKSGKLSLNVKGEGYAVHAQLTMDGSAPDGSGDGVGGAQPEVEASMGGVESIQLLPAPAMNHMDFGAVQMHDSVAKKVSIKNVGKFNFDFNWTLMSTSPVVQLAGQKRLNGTLHKSEALDYEIRFSPVSEAAVDDVLYRCSIAGKYDYLIAVRGVGVRPALHMSFLRHDFGKCFVTQPGGQPVVEEVILRCTNREPLANVSLECNFQKTRVLQVECTPTVLEAGESLDVPLRFAPREQQDYAFNVPFVVNGNTRVNVAVLGSGISPRLELANPAHSMLNFGVVQLGAEPVRQVRLLNPTRKVLPVQLIDEQYMGQGKLEQHNVNVSPSATEIMIPPRDSATITVRFNAKRRVPAFSEDLMVSYAGTTRKLLTVTGQAVGMELALDTDTLPFGTVCVGSHKVKALTLSNTGDVPARFSWQSASFGPHFTVSPLEGVVVAHSEATFSVTFAPQEMSQDIRQDNIVCVIEGAAPLLLSCAGVCVPQPADEERTLEFASKTRSPTSQTVTVSNPTNKAWFVSPVLSGEHWHVPSAEVNIPSKGSADIEVVFEPLSMTLEEGQQHEGSMFIALPDGSAQLYKLVGTAAAPDSSGTIEATTTAKEWASLTVPLHNWLAQPQHFLVNVELNDVAEDDVVTQSIQRFSAANAVDVGANGNKNFPVRFLSYKQGNVNGTITFTNPQTGEYCFFDLQVTVEPTSVLETFALEAPVRQTARHAIVVDNPLPSEVGITFADGDEWWECDNQFVRLVRVGQMQGSQEGTFEFEFRPLVQTSAPEEVTLRFRCEELGEYVYKATLTATPPPARPKLRFETTLGRMQTEVFTFRSFNTGPTEYSCSLDGQGDGAFSVEGSVRVDAAPDWDGIEERVSVTFDPQHLGSATDVLVLRGDAGEYTCELVGFCKPPLPQGPFQVPNGGSTDVVFRNCFSESRVFSVAVDNTCFSVAAPTVTVAGKADVRIPVRFTAPADGEGAGAAGDTAAATAGKVVVRCDDAAEAAQEASAVWTFYVHGQA